MGLGIHSSAVHPPGPEGEGLEGLPPDMVHAQLRRHGPVCVWGVGGQQKKPLETSSRFKGAENAVIPRGRVFLFLPLGPGGKPRFSSANRWEV